MQHCKCNIVFQSFYELMGNNLFLQLSCLTSVLSPLAFLPELNHTRCVPISGPLHLLFPRSFGAPKHGALVPMVSHAWNQVAILVSAQIILQKSLCNQPVVISIPYYTSSPTEHKIKGTRIKPKNRKERKTASICR